MKLIRNNKKRKNLTFLLHNIDINVIVLTFLLLENLKKQINIGIIGAPART